MQNIWSMKNSQDYLHHMKFEQESFNMIAAPFLADLYTWVNNERSTLVGSDGIDSLTITLYMSVRVLILAGFIFHLSYSATHKTAWVLYYVFIALLYFISAISYLVYSMNDDQSYYPIRKISIYCEALGIPALFLYQVYNYFYLKKLRAEGRHKAM